MTSATDELRRLLDERGVEYTVIPDDGYSREYIKIGSTEIWTNDRDEVAVYCLTPEQAIEATLGSDLKAENAKLRELLLWVDGQWEYMREALESEFHDRMRKLGIEVDA